MAPVATNGLLRRLLEEAALGAARALATAYDMPTTYAQTPSPRRFVAVIGFTGPHVHGTAVLEMELDDLIRSNPVNTTPRDWVAELANQLLGRMKNKLLPHGIELQAAPPAVVSGHYLVATDLEDGRAVSLNPIVGPFRIWIEAQSRDGVSFSDDASLADEIPAEGDVLLF